MSYFHRALAFITLLVLFTPGLRAQYDTSAVTGLITDPSGASVAHVAVTLREIEKGITQVASSTSTGDYVFPSVQVGHYVVSVSVPGYEPVTTEPFEVVVNARLRVDVPLKVQGVRDEVQVNSGAVAIETDTSDRGTVIGQQEIDNLPLNGREYADLALLAPGVQLGSLEDGSVEQRRGSFNVNGMRSSVNNFVLDGLDNNSYHDGNQGFNNQALTPSVDSVREFKIITSNYPAEYGRSGGAVINVTTRSGSNRFHASVWEYLRNTIFNSYGPIIGSGVKPTLVQNQFGAAAGGAIRRDKTFYYVDYEGFRQYTGTYQTASVPTMDQRAGIFYNETGQIIPLKNPFTGELHNDGLIPASDVTPFAAAVIAALPAPTGPGFTTNFVNLGRGSNTRDQADVRVDQYFGSRIQTFARVSQQLNHITEAPPIPGLAGGNNNGHPHVVTSRLALGFTWAVKPNAVLDSRFGITQTISGKYPYNFGYPSFFTQFGIPYPIDPRAGTVSLNTQTVQGYTAFGAQDSQHLIENPVIYEPKVSYSIVHGRHNISFGYGYLALYMHTERQIPIFGHDTYNNTAFDAAPTTTKGTTARQEAYSLTNFMYGARSVYELANYVENNQNQRFHSAFLEDSWRAMSKLTLNMGLRYEFAIPDFESDNHLANFDPNTNTLVLAHAGSYEQRSLVAARKTNFAPRFGFAYSIDPKFVVRGSYGMSYVLVNRASNASLEYNGPYAVTTTVTQSAPVVGAGTGDKAGQLCSTTSQSLACFRSTQEGYPTSMISQSQFSTQASQSIYVPTHIPTGYLQFYQLGYQIQVTPTTLFDVAYVGSHGVHLLVIGDWNQARTLSSATDTSSLAARRPISNFNDIMSGLPYGFLRYNSLQVKLQHKSKGFFILNSLTWSQARDNASGDLEAAHGDGVAVNIANVAGDSGISGYNQPLNDSLALTWELPIPKFRHGILNEAIGGWRLTAINRVTSGFPLNLNYAPSSAAVTTTVAYQYRPNIIGPSSAVELPKNKWTRDAGGFLVAFDPSLISTPAANVLYGNSPRNGVRFVPRENTDLGVHKEFPVYETLRLQFRAEAFNLLNHPNWNAPNTATTAATFGEITTAAPSRQIQFALRLNY